MQKEKGSLLLALVILVVGVGVFAGAGYYAWHFYSTSPAEPETNNEPQTIGGDKDSHGCLIGAGYSWCDAKQKCLRAWEEPCEPAAQTEGSPSQSSQATAGWKTYTNTQYGFEIKLPPSIASDASVQEVRDFYWDASYKEIFIATLHAGCNFYVYPNINDKFLSEIGKVAGLKNYQLAVLENSKGQKYYIGYRPMSSAVEVDECLPDLNQMLSTFKFTTPASASVAGGTESGKGTDNCIAYSLDSLQGCYSKNCIKLNPEINKQFFIGKTIIDAGTSGTYYKFIDNNTVEITHGRSVDSPGTPAQYKNWTLENGQITIQDSSLIFKNVNFYNCGSGKLEGYVTTSWWADYGDGYKERTSELKLEVSK